jgi:hypothetical protein
VGRQVTRGHCTLVTRGNLVCSYSRIHEPCQGERWDLSGWGARYTEKKARREVSDFAGLGLGSFVRCGSRILRVFVAKKPDVVGLLGFKGA